MGDEEADGDPVRGLTCLRAEHVRGRTSSVFSHLTCTYAPRIISMSAVNCRTAVHASLRGGMSERMEGVRPGFAAGAGVQRCSNTWDRNSWPHCYLRAAAPAPTPHQGPGRARSSPGIARDTEYAARPRNARFVDTVDSYKILTRRAPQRRPPPRPARPAAYGGPCQCGILLNR